MAAPFESIVRPFQTPGSLNPTPLTPVPNIVPAAPIAVSFGAIGAVPTAQTSGVNFTTQKTQTFVELSRKNRTIKVSNPDDPTQSVSFQDTKEIKFGVKTADSAPVTTSTSFNTGSTAGAGTPLANPDGADALQNGADVNGAGFAYLDQPLAANEEVIDAGPAREIPITDN